jgi:hypothetical protein
MICGLYGLNLLCDGLNATWLCEWPGLEPEPDLEWPKWHLNMWFVSLAVSMKLQIWSYFFFILTDQWWPKWHIYGSCYFKFRWHIFVLHSLLPWFVMTYIGTVLLYFRWPIWHTILWTFIQSIRTIHSFIHSFIRSTSAKNKKAAKKKTPVKKKLMKNAAAPTTKVVRNLTDILNDGQ